MDVSANELFALAFGLWAGVVGYGCRLFLSNLASFGRTQLELRMQVTKLQAEFENHDHGARTD